MYSVFNQFYLLTLLNSSHHLWQLSYIVAGVDCPISPTRSWGPGPTATPSLPPWPPPPWLTPAPDPAYWLVTVLHTNTTDWTLARNLFEPRLGRLYSIAFQRLLLFYLFLQ